MALDINPFDGDGVDGKAALTGAAALALGLLGRKGYTSAKIIGPETLQTYLKGTKATGSFLETPSGRRLMGVLERTNPRTQRSNFLELADPDRRIGYQQAVENLAPEGIIQQPQAAKLVRYDVGAVPYKSREVRGEQRSFVPVRGIDPRWANVVNSVKVVDENSGEVLNLTVDQLRKKGYQSMWLKPTKLRYGDILKKHKEGKALSTNPADYDEIVVSKERFAQAKQKGPMNPYVPLYPGSPMQQALSGPRDPVDNPIYDVPKSFEVVSGNNPNLEDRILQEGFDVNDPNSQVSQQYLKEAAIQALAANRQAANRYMGLGLYRNLLEQRRAKFGPTRSLVEDFRSRVGAQRDYRKLIKAAAEPRRQLREDFPAQQQSLDELSGFLGETNRGALNRIKAAFSARTASGTPDESAVNLVDKDLDDVMTQLKRNRDTGKSRLNVDDDFYTVDPKYVSKVGYQKNPNMVHPATGRVRPADFVPAAAGKAGKERNNSLRLLLEGRSYPNKDTIIEDEILAVTDPKAPPFEGTPTEYTTKTGSLTKALKGQNEVVVDQADVINAIGPLPTIKESEDAERVAATIFRSPAYSLFREAERRALTEGAARGGDDLFLEQAMANLRGLGSEDLALNKRESLAQFLSRVKKRNERKRMRSGVIVDPETGEVFISPGSA